VVRVSGKEFEVLRVGVVPEKTLNRLASLLVVFVCTGNTCRSPLAVALSRKMLAERLGTTPGKLPEAGWEILSAGVWAADDLPASPVAIQAAGELGADLTGHRSRKLTKDLIDQADMVFCMSNEHVAAVVELLPTSAGKVRRLSPREDISDPAGGPAEVYRRTAKKIQQALHDILGKELHENRTRR
jgi:protein-tyrosine phosphatase